MASKIKGIYKGFKSISHIFVVKEREMEIGQPTDVKHVAHVGVSHSSTVSPSWMNEFRFGPDTTTTTSTDNTNISHPTTPLIDNTIVSHPTTLSKRSSQGLDQSIESQPATKKMRNRSCTDLPNVTMKRKRRKKSKSNSVTESSSTRTRRISKTKKTSTQLSLSPDIEI